MDRRLPTILVHWVTLRSFELTNNELFCIGLLDADGMLCMFCVFEYSLNCIVLDGMCVVLRYVVCCVSTH